MRDREKVRELERECPGPNGIFKDHSAEIVLDNKSYKDGFYMKFECKNKIGDYCEVCES